MMDRLEFKPTPRETEFSIRRWLDDTFPRSAVPQEELQVCVAALLEEAVEVAVAAGMALPRVTQVVQTCYMKSLDDFAKTYEVAGEAADVHLCLVSLCRVLGTTLDTSVQERMLRNRSRPQSYYDAKRQRKASIGLR